MFEARKSFAGLIGALLSFSAVTPLSAQTFPGKPITIYHVTPAGGTTNSILLLLGDRMGQGLGQKIINEARPGGNGNIAALALMRAPADGYTLMTTHSSLLTTFPLLSKAQFDPRKDFKPITPYVTNAGFVYVSVDSKLKSIADLVAYSKSKPGGLLTGVSVGVLNETFIMFKMATNAEMTSVPYKGSVQAMNDLAGGRLDLFFANMQVGKPFVDSGRVRVLAATNAQRAETMPDIPTMVDLGYPDVVNNAWFGLFAPAGTPDAVVRIIHREVAKALTDPKVRESLLGLGLIPNGASPEEFEKVLAVDYVRAAKLVKASGIKPDQ